jgi:hypothetical protein
MKKQERDRYPGHQQRDDDEHSFPFSDLRRGEFEDESIQDYTFPHAANRGSQRSSSSLEPAAKGVSLSFFDKMKSFAEDFGGKKVAKKIEPETKVEQKPISNQQPKLPNPVLNVKLEPQKEEQLETKVNLSVAQLAEPENVPKQAQENNDRFHQRESEALNRIIKPVQESKKGSLSPPPKGISVEVKEDLVNILKKASENSQSKTKMIEEKREFEKLLSSTKKPVYNGVVIKVEKKYNRDSLVSDFGVEETSLRKLDQSKVQPSEQQKVRKEKFTSEKEGKKLDIESEAKELKTYKPRKSVEQIFDPNYILNDSQSFEEYDLQKSMIDKKVLMEDERKDLNLSKILEESGSFNHQKDGVDFTTNHRNRRSYFPEKLLRKVNSNDRETESPSQPLSEEHKIELAQIKGNYYDVYSKKLRENRLSDVFNRRDFTEPESDEKLNDNNEEARYDPKFEQMKQLQIESLVNFEQSMNQMIAENNENLTTHNKDLLAKPENLGYENFEDVVREVVRKKMLLCVNMSCRVRCLFDISSELAEKTAMLEQELAKMEEEKHHLENRRNYKEASDLFRLLSVKLGLKYFTITQMNKEGTIFDLTFSVQDVLSFNILVERDEEEISPMFFIKNGSCKASPVLRIKKPGLVNPLNNPSALETLFNRLIYTTMSDVNRTDALNFLSFISAQFRKIEFIKRSLNQALAKHKISDILLDSANLEATLILFPKINRLNFSLKMSFGLLCSNEPPKLSVLILSSNLRKTKTDRSEILGQIEEKCMKGEHNIPITDDFVFRAIEHFANIINEFS